MPKFANVSVSLIHDPGGELPPVTTAFEAAQDVDGFIANIYFLALLVSTVFSEVSQELRVRIVPTDGAWYREQLNRPTSTGVTISE